MQASYEWNPTGFPKYPTTSRLEFREISPIFPTASEGISDHSAPMALVLCVVNLSTSANPANIGSAADW